MQIHHSGFLFQGLQTVFLDRDGVIVEKMPEGMYLCSATDLRILPGVPRAIARLNQAGIRVLVATNQRGVALGLYTGSDVENIHQEVQRRLSFSNAHIDAFYFCPHERCSCNCRKPLPGMFAQAASDFSDITAENCVMIGDSLSDIQFGCSLGMATVWITGNGADSKGGGISPGRLATASCPSLSSAVDILLAEA